MSKQSCIIIFIISWLSVLLTAYFLLPKFLVEYLIKTNSIRYSQVGVLGSFGVMIVFTFIMYLIDSKLDGLRSVVRQIKKIDYNEKELSQYLISKLSGHVILAGVMVSILVLIIGFFGPSSISTEYSIQEFKYSNIVIDICTLLLLIGIGLEFLVIDIYINLSGKKWTNNQDERDMLIDRAFSYYLISLHFLANSLVLLASLVSTLIAFIGYIIFILIATRYYFFRNLPHWKL